MMEFVFAEKPTVRICGKDYEFDPSNNDLLTGVVEHFPQIVAAANDLQGLSRRKGALSDPELCLQILEKNRQLTESCRDFIQGCLGVEEYNEIFHKRRPNSAEHVSLCTFLYNAMMEGREGLLDAYLEEDDDAAEEAAAETERGADSDRL